MMRKLGLDVGDKTVGIAVSDPSSTIAQGLYTLGRVGIRKDTGKIIDLIREHDCDAVIIGLPVNMDGEDSIQTAKVREFADMLNNKLKSSAMSNVRIHWQDERLTTVQAERVLIEGGVRREKRKQVIDKQAAVIILQTWLDSQ